MRTIFTLPIVLLSLFTAGADAAFISSADAAPARARAVRYTDAPAYAAPARIVQIQVDRNFTLYERSKILRAVNEWNHVLNGHVRLDIAPEAFDASHVAAGGRLRANGWAIVKTDSRNPMLTAKNMKSSLAVTTGTRRAVILVVTNRLGSRDLAGIMMHEFGHALGASCIDEGAVRDVAIAQELSLDDLNWCGDEVAHRH